MVTGLRFALAAVSGCLNGIAFIFDGSLALCANVPLLCVLWKGGGGALLFGALGGLVGFLAGLHIYGIWSYGVALFLGFGLYTGSQMVIYALLLKAFWGRHRLLDLLLPVAAWGLTEQLRTLGPISMPASYAGCIADVGFLRPWFWAASWMGGLGVSCLVALAQSALFFGLFHPRTHGRYALGSALLLALLGVYGGLNPPDLSGRTLKTAIVQGGLANAQYDAALIDAAAMRDVVSSYALLSRQAYDKGAELVIWPETAVRAPVLKTPTLQKRLFPRAEDHSVLLAGLIREEEGMRYNSAVALAPGGAVVGHYDKARLVPGVEAEFTQGQSEAVISTDIGRLGVLICLESVYPEMGRALAKKGAELLVVMSNDAGFGRSPISHHMVNRARVRAVENGRWLLRAGQAGVSAIIDPRGQMRGELPLFQSGLLQGEVTLRDEKTLYTRLGPWPCVLCFVVLLWGIALRIKARRDERMQAG